MTIDLNAFSVKSAADYRDDMIRAYRNGLIRRGKADPDVSEGTSIYIRFSSLANQLAAIAHNTALKSNEAMPDTATGAALDRWANNLGLARRPAGSSSGRIEFSASISSVLIPQGSQLIDRNGLIYEVSTGGTYLTTQTVPVRSVATGEATNLDGGAILNWISQAFVSQRATVTDSGLSGGVDDESDSVLRARVLAKFANAPGSGDWSFLKELAEETSDEIQAAYIYSCIDGPSTVGMCLTRAPNATDKNRDIDATTLSGTIIPLIVGQLPEYIETESLISTPDNVPTDVAFTLALPPSPKSEGGGTGGGFIDSTPFPQDDGAGYCAVDSVTSETVFSVVSSVAPIAGISHIAWLSPFDWTLYRGLVSSFTGSGPYELTLDTPFVGIAEGQHISPDAEFIDEYFDVVLESFANLGPGEKVDPDVHPGIFPRGYRKPLPSLESPSDLNARMLSDLNSATNVLDSQFLYRSVTTPGIPASVLDPPLILVPRKLSFLKAD